MDEIVPVGVGRELSLEAFVTLSESSSLHDPFSICVSFKSPLRIFCVDTKSFPLGPPPEAGGSYKNNGFSPFPVVDRSLFGPSSSDMVTVRVSMAPVSTGVRCLGGG